MMDSRPLRFEHLVEVNDPLQPPATWVSRAQLWNGLRLRMLHPQVFQPWLDSCEVSWQADGSLRRALVYGETVVRDRVVFSAPDRLDCEVDAGPGGRFSLQVSVEEPAQAHLFLRFVYSAQSEDHSAGSPYAEAIQQAWRRGDEDTVLRLRQLALSGGLDD